jgi:hypothetical protein
MSLKDRVKREIDKLDIYKDKGTQRVVFVPRQDERVEPPRVRLGKSLETFADDWRLLRQLEKEFIEYKEIMSRYTNWPTSGRLKRQLEHGFISILSQLLGATWNKEDNDLHETLKTRIEFAKSNSGLRKDRIFAFEEIITWAIGEKRGNWAEKPGYDDVSGEWDEVFGDEVPTDDES